MELIKQIFIKDLIILQSPCAFKMIEKYIRSAEKKGVYIGELAINPYIYKSRSFDISFLINYIRSLDNLAGIFRELYDDLIYNLKLLKLINNDDYNNTDFHIIFNQINNKFNLYLDDQFLFEDFGIYMSETSLDTCMALYDTFINTFISIMKNSVNENILKSICMHRNIINTSYIYETIFEQFEYIYLPFY